jgi:hypothetical protein
MYRESLTKERGLGKIHEWLSSSEWRDERAKGDSSHRSNSLLC